MKLFLLLTAIFTVAGACLYAGLAGLPTDQAGSNLSTKQASPFIILPSIFSDNMVLQRQSEVTFWGKANPNVKVTIEAGWGASAETKVKDDSSWQVKIKTTQTSSSAVGIFTEKGDNSVQIKTAKAGGPFEVKVSAGDTSIVYKNVMLGEVWVCSGQSNMEMPVEGWPPQNIVKNSTEEIKEADYPDIRLFTVSRAYSTKPEFNCSGNWSECNPKTAAPFSAAAYFFGRELYNKLKVPIGLIHSSWGGTFIESWISGKYLGEDNEYKPTLEKLIGLDSLLKISNDWIHNHPVIDISAKDIEHRWENLEFGDSACSKPDFNDSNWKLMKLPAYWEADSIGEFDGIVWYRKNIIIPQSWINKELVLELGPVDDMDRTFINGVRVGGMEQVGFWSTPRIYTVAKEIVKDSSLTIAVRVLDNGGGGGIWGNGVKMKIHLKDSVESISLSGEWKYLPVAEYISNKFYVYKIEGEEFYSRPKTPIGLSENTPTMLYNGMIAPLIPYGIKGAIWYQGENNSGKPDNYYKLLPLLIKNWREDWGEGNFPFYYVQIAPFIYDPNTRSQVIRDAQFKTLTVLNTGMAVTLDIGEVNNIHPADKQDVGKRLALWALAKNYNKKLVYSGPIYKSMKIRKNKIVLSFDQTGKGLVLKNINENSNFIIAAEDMNFVKAQAKIEGKKLVVFSDEVKKPVAVRYAWSNDAEATLFNKEGLPASTFKTDDWSK